MSAVSCAQNDPTTMTKPLLDRFVAKGMGFRRMSLNKFLNQVLLFVRASIANMQHVTKNETKHETNKYVNKSCEH